MQNFQFCAPRSIEEALNILSEKSGQCRVIAGGTDLIPALRKEETHPASVLSILEVGQLKGVREEKGHIRIGPTTTFTEITQDEILTRSLPLLVEAASWVGGPTIRNRGTIGGNICNASPAADVMPAVMALGGVLELQSKSAGTRTLPVTEASAAPYQTGLRSDELLLGILIKKFPSGTKHAYEKLGRRNAMARAHMNLSVVLSQDGGGTISDLRIVPGAIEAVARRIHAAEKVLLGKKPEEPLIEEAATELIGDLTGVWIPEYKLPVLRNIFIRVLRKALN